MESVNLIAEDFYKIYGTTDPLTVSLFDSYGNPFVNTPIKFNINGVLYNRYTNDDGVAKLNINLPVGVYPTVVTYEGDSTYNSATKNITITVTNKNLVVLHVSDFVKTWGEAKALKATLYERDATPITGKQLQFTINGVTYNRTTNNDGVASLNINLPKGTYRCVVDSPEDETHEAYQANCNVKVMADTFMDGTNITKMEDELVVYQCAVYDNWNRIDCNVSITVNGVTYTRHTESDGLARLNVRLPAGEYDITARFTGDDLNHPSSVTNHVSSVKRIQELSSVRNGVITPGENRGFMESKVYFTYIPVETSQKNNYAYETLDIANIEQQNYPTTPFTSYEITETDPRVKTARVTTNYYMDLTRGRFWVYITSPYHENFGGRILKVDYDKDKQLYTYQCQDGRRQYLNKRRSTSNGTGVTVYQYLEGLLINPSIIGKGEYTVPLTDTYRKAGAKLLSGLQPIENYDNLKLSPGLKASGNLFRRPCPEMLSYDRIIDKILALCHMDNGGGIDVYFTPDGVCHIDPVDIDKWLKTGLKLTHSDLVHYKYGFDITNIITGVSIKTSDKKYVNYYYEEWKDLASYFGANWSMVDPVTTTTTSSTGTASTTTTSSTGKTYNTCGVSNDGKEIMAIGRQSAVGESHYGYQNLYKSVFKNYCPLCGHASLTWGYKWSGRYPCVTKFNNGSAGRNEGHIYCGNCDADYSCIDGKNHVSSGKPLLTRISGPVKSSEAEANKLKAGNYTDGSTANTTTPSVNTTANTTVTDETATYQKALEEMSKSVRDLLSFELRVPLNSTVFKNLHTNMMLWTELPSEFKLGNLEKVFKLMQSYKQNRGVSYVENRWYVEGVKIKCDSKGLFADITLNPFPSSYSTYSNAIKSYQEAYDQAFKQKTNNTNNTTTTTTSSNGSADQIFKEVASICEKYRYSLGRGVSSYSAMKKAGHGDCWAFAELVYEELKARGVNTIIWTYATSAAGNHRSSGYQAADGSWKNFPYRTYVKNPKQCVNGGNNWYFDFNRPSKAGVIKRWTGGKAL